LLLACALALGSSTAQCTEATRFEKEIRPLLKTSCVSCHNPQKKWGGLDLARFEKDTDVGMGEEVWAEVTARYVLKD
jgi:hypothetical protein